MARLAPPAILSLDDPPSFSLSAVSLLFRAHVNTLPDSSLFRLAHGVQGAGARFQRATLRCPRPDGSVGPNARNSAVALVGEVGDSVLMWGGLCETRTMTMLFTEKKGQPPSAIRGLGRTQEGCIACLTTGSRGLPGSPLLDRRWILHCIEHFFPTAVDAV